MLNVSECTCSDSMYAEGTFDEIISNSAAEFTSVGQALMRSKGAPETASLLQ